ncbi:MAG: ATP-binding cassette domain-containing protein [Ignavibacteriae bacterium]|nr:ATP-binding cassette domain-containing protein [Ignavibacteriota bacterium]
MNEILKLHAEKVGKKYLVTNNLTSKEQGVKEVLVGFTLTLGRKEIKGLKGKSGIGKTTFAKILAGLLRPSHGQVYLGAEPMYREQGYVHPHVRKHIRMIFQRTNAPFNPRVPVYDAIEEPLIIYRNDLTKAERKELVFRVAKEVHLDHTLLTQYPLQLSGGQRRVAAIARAIIVRPTFLIADEPTAGIDSQWRKRILDLFTELYQNEGIGILLISHDYKALGYVCQGNIEEITRC